MRRGGRRGERGAETLELIGCAGLLALVVLGARTAVEAAHLQAAAEEDARILARWQVTCDGAHPLRLLDVDPGLARRGGVESLVSGPGGVVHEVIDVPAPAVLAGIGIRIHAAASMLREPGCNGP